MNPASPPSPIESLWTVADVASFLQVSRSWVYQRAAENVLPHIKVGALVRFDPRTIRALAAGDAKSQVIAVSKP